MSKHSKSSRDSCVVPFHCLINSPLVGGVYGATLSPANLGSRLPVEADNWAHYRVKSLAFRLHPLLAASTTQQAAGYIGGVQDTPPSVVPQVMELIPSCFQAKASTVPTEWVKVSKVDLAGPLPWYKAVAGAADATEEYPGVLVITGNTTETFILEVKGVYEFKVAIAPANTPEFLKLRLQARELRQKEAANVEKQRLLAVLAGAALTCPTGGKA